MLSLIRSKLSRQRRSDRLLSATFQPIDDPLHPIENDLTTILEDVKAIALDKRNAKNERG
jgi:hypothetical protein